MRSVSRATLTALAGVIFLLPVVAAAHGILVGSSPAANSNLAVAPSELRLIFNERPERAFTRLSLTSPTGIAVPLGTLSFGPGHVAWARIAGRLIPGVYTVAWQTVGRDGHPVNGTFTFAIAPDAVGVAAAESEDPSAVPPPGGYAPSPAMRASDLAPFATLLRWLTLAAVVAALGSVVFRFLVVGRLRHDMPPDVSAAYVQPLETGAGLLGLWAAVVLLASAAARLLVQRAALDTGAGGGTLATLLGATMWGRAWMLHVAGAAIAAVGFVLTRRGSRGAWLTAAAGGFLATTGLALSGHAVSVPQFVPLTVIGHVIHAIAAASWLGTLLAIAVVALPLSFRLERNDRWRVVADIVQVFSPAALAFAAVTVVAGVLIAWSHLRVLEALWLSEYGRVLLLKVGLVAVTAMVGAYNWLRVRPSLGEHPGARRLRRSATTELAFAALVLAVTAVLVATPMPPR